MHAFLPACLKLKGLRVVCFLWLGRLKIKTKDIGCTWRMDGKLVLKKKKKSKLEVLTGSDAKWKYWIWREGEPARRPAPLITEI